MPETLLQRLGQSTPSGSVYPQAAARGPTPSECAGDTMRIFTCFSTAKPTARFRPPLVPAPCQCPARPGAPKRGKRQPGAGEGSKKPSTFVVTPPPTPVARA